MKIERPNILFLTLYTFSLTGGIEKISRALAKVLNDLMLLEIVGNLNVLSMYDNTISDKRYISNKHFTAYKGKRFSFAVHSFFKGLKADTIILGHINLLIFALLIKIFNHKAKVVVYAHGIEVWRKLPKWKVNFLKQHCEIWAVSRYTAKQLEKNSLPGSIIKIVNNCLDPYFEQKSVQNKSNALLNKYGLNKDQPVLFTLTRMSSKEKYKGYDQVITVIKNLRRHFPGIRYILSGNADPLEKERVVEQIMEHGLEKYIILTGHLAEDELLDHYHLADIFVMPSKGEGFGISFIEAAACGVPSIAGNKDGSTDALLNGELGTLIDPDDENELEEAIIELINSCIQDDFSNCIQQKCFANFSFQQYAKNIQAMLNLDVITDNHKSSLT